MYSSFCVCVGVCVCVCVCVWGGGGGGEMRGKQNTEHTRKGINEFAE